MRPVNYWAAAVEAEAGAVVAAAGAVVAAAGVASTGAAAGAVAAAAGSAAAVDEAAGAVAELSSDLLQPVRAAAAMKARAAIERIFMVSSSFCYAWNKSGEWVPDKKTGIPRRLPRLQT